MTGACKPSGPWSSVASESGSGVVARVKEDFLATQAKCSERKPYDRKQYSRRWVVDGILRIFAPLFFIGLTAYSVYNAYTPVVRHYEISINKKLERPLRIGMASDLHTGILVGARQLDKLADIMQRE